MLALLSMVVSLQTHYMSLPRGTGFLNAHVAEVNACIAILVNHVCCTRKAKTSIATIHAFWYILRTMLSGLSADEVIWEDVIGISISGARLGLSAAEYVPGWLELVSATGGVCYWEQIWSRYAFAGCFGIRPTTPLNVSRVTDFLVSVFFVLTALPRTSIEWVFADAVLNTLLRIVVILLRRRLLAQCVAFSDASRTSASAGSSLDAL
jgi:hypothetical protein